MKPGQQGQIVAAVYREWAAEQAGSVALDAAYATNDPTAYAETCEALSADDAAQADLLERTRAALAAGGKPQADRLAAVRRALAVLDTARSTKAADLRARVLGLGGTGGARTGGLLTPPGGWSLPGGGTENWKDQLRVPQGNGPKSGRWVYTPWMHLDDLVSGFDGLDQAVLGEDDVKAVSEARKDVDAAVDAMDAVDRGSFDPRDEALGEAIEEAAAHLADAEKDLADSPDLADLGQQAAEARQAITEFGETDWSLLEEATDIGHNDGAATGGRTALWVWTEDLPGDEPVGEDSRTSQELKDELDKIKAHPVAPSPAMRRKRAAAMQELNDRRARDEGTTPDVPATPEPDERAALEKTIKDLEWRLGTWLPSQLKGETHARRVASLKRQKVEMEQSLAEAKARLAELDAPPAPDAPADDPEPTPPAYRTFKDLDDAELQKRLDMYMGQREDPLRNGIVKDLKAEIEYRKAHAEWEARQGAAPDLSGLSDEELDAEIKRLKDLVAHRPRATQEWKDGLNKRREAAEAERDRRKGGAVPELHKDDWYPEDQKRYKPSPSGGTSPYREGEVVPSYQLGARQQERFLALDDDRRIEFNYLVRTGATVPEALAAVEALPAPDAPPEFDTPLVKWKRTFLGNGNGSWHRISTTAPDGTEWNIDAGHAYGHPEKGKFVVTKGDETFSEDGYIGLSPEAEPVYFDTQGAAKQYITDQMSRNPDPTSVQPPLGQEERFGEAFKTAEEASTQEEFKDALREIRRMALFERAARTRDVLSDDGFQALTGLVSAVSRGDDHEWESNMQILRQALRKEGTPDRWKGLSSILSGAKMAPEPDVTGPDDVDDEKANLHADLRKGLRDVRNAGNRVSGAGWVEGQAKARREASLALDGVMDDLVLDKATAEGERYTVLQSMFKSLNEMNAALQTNDRDAWYEAADGFWRMSRALPEGDLWRTMGDQVDQVREKWAVDFLAEPEYFDTAGHENVADDLTLAKDKTALHKALKDLWGLAVNAQYKGNAGGQENLQRLSGGLSRMAAAAENESPTQWEAGLAETLDALGQVEVKEWGARYLPVFTALGPKWAEIFRGDADVVDRDLKARYGTLEPEKTTPEGVIASIGMFYSTRKSNSNCVLASTVYELRRRGIDAHPKQATKGRDSSATQRAWFRTSYGDEVTVDGLKGRQAPMRYKITADTIKASFPAGARGTIRAGWKGRNFGHIWNWEVDADGEVVFYDPQTAQVIGSSRTDYWGEIDWRFVTLQRLDDKALKPDIEVALAPPEDSVKAAGLEAESVALAQAKEDRDNLINEYNKVKEKYYKAARAAPGSNPGTMALKEEADRLYEMYVAANQAYAALKASPTGKRLAEVGNAFPFLDPSVYKMR